MKVEFAFILFFCFFLSKKSNASDSVLLKFISENQDTVNLHVSDIIRIDTIKNILELTPSISGKLSGMNFTKGMILCNSGIGKWDTVFVCEVFAAELKGEAIIYLHNNNPFFYNDYTLEIGGSFWREIAEKYNK